MKKLIFITAALLAAASAQAQENLTDLYAKAVEAFNGRDYVAAAPAFQQLIDKGSEATDPDVQGYVATARQNLPRVYFMLGGAAAQAGKLDDALANFKKSAELAELYGNRSQVGQSNGWVDRISAELGLQRGREQAEAAMQTADLEQYAQAMKTFGTVVALDATRYADQIQKAQAQMDLYTRNMVALMQQKGNNDAVIAMADRMIAADPADALAHRIRQQTLFAKKDYAAVVEASTAALAAQKDDAGRSEVNYVLGAAYNARQQSAQALEAFRKVTAGPYAATAKAAADALAKAQAN